MFVCVWLAAEQDGQNVGGKAESPVERCQAQTQVRSGPGSVLISSALSAAHTPIERHPDTQLFTEWSSEIRRIPLSAFEFFSVMEMYVPSDI